MLELIDTQSLETFNVIRLATQQQNEDFLRDQGFDDQDVQEMLDFLLSRNISDNPEDCLTMSSILSRNCRHRHSLHPGHAVKL